MTGLLEPEFMRRLGRLRVLVRRRFAGTTGGARRSTRRGSSAEFADHRPYYHGDDVRRIDWNAYARLEELVLRLYVAEEDLTVYLLLDASLSSSVGHPPKIEVAKRIAAALGYVALCGSERVAVTPYAEGMLSPMPPVRGQRRTMTLLRYLEEVEASGRTDLSRSVDQFLARKGRPGLVVLLSDLLDPGGYQRPIDRLISERHEPVIFHVLDREEIDPTPGGDLLLVDVERGTEVDVSLDRAAVAAYCARMSAFITEAEGYARRRGLAYVRVTGDVAFEDAILSYLGAA